MTGLVFGTGYIWPGVYCIISGSKISVTLQTLPFYGFLRVYDTTLVVTSSSMSKMLMTWSNSFTPLDHYFKEIPMCTHVRHIITTAVQHIYYYTSKMV